MQRTFLIAAVLLATSAGPAAADGGLTLDQVIDKTLSNPLVRAAKHRTDAARARRDEARGARYPQLSVTSFVAPSPDIECLNVECTETDPAEAAINVGGVFGGVQASLTQPIYTFGKLSSIGRAADRAARATGLLEHKVAGDLAHQAAQAYYGVKLARELVWMLEDGMEQIEKAQKTLEERLADGSGDVTVQDRLRLETLVAEVKARLSEAREAEASALAGLRALVGDPSANVDDGLLEAVEYELAASPDGYVGRARDARPDLRAARLGARSVDALVAFEKSRYWPDLALIAGFNVTGATSVTDPPSAFANDPYNTIGAQLALVLRWKLDPASQPARVARAEAESHRAAALVEAAELGATFEVKRAHARAQQAKRRLEAVASGEKSAKGWVASVLQADAIGTASAKEMADAYVAYFTLRGRVLQSTYDWNVATVALRRAIGEFSASSGRP